MVTISDPGFGEIYWYLLSANAIEFMMVKSIEMKIFIKGF